MSELKSVLEWAFSNRHFILMMIYNQQQSHFQLRHKHGILLSIYASINSIEWKIALLLRLKSSSLVLQSRTANNASGYCEVTPFTSLATLRSIY